MKNKKLIAAAVALAGLFIFLSSFQQSQEKYLIVRTIESVSGSGFDSKIIIVNEYGGIEEAELGRMNDKSFPDNVKKISTVFNKLADKGYRLVSSNANGIAVIAGTYVFERK